MVCRSCNSKRTNVNVVQHYLGSGKLELTGGTVSKLKNKIKAVNKALTELEDLLSQLSD
jgi:hypothetical protein